MFEASISEIGRPREIRTGAQMSEWLDRGETYRSVAQLFRVSPAAVHHHVKAYRAYQRGELHGRALGFTHPLIRR